MTKCSLNVSKISNLFNFQLIFIIFNSIVHSKEVKSILSKKESINWINSFNKCDSTNNTYCRLYCINIKSNAMGDSCGFHTLCKYKKGVLGPNCKGYIALGYSKIEKETILDAHNTLRNHLASGDEGRGDDGPQPSASNMRALKWNDELADIAERWAAQCVYANDICRDLDRFPVGQNIARGYFGNNNFLTFINSWYEEVNFYNKSDVSQFKYPDSNSSSTTKYTQMVWAETYLLGCARAVFQSNERSEVSYVEQMICNYGPSGNIPNQPLYLQGSPCTACQEGTSCNLEYPSLCEIDLINNGNKNKYKKEFKQSKTAKGARIRSSVFYYILFLFIFQYFE